MDMSRIHKTKPRFSKRHLGLAGVAAIIACAACCALPFLAAAGLGSGAAAALGRFLRPGSELVIGGIVFAALLGVMAIRNRLRRPSGCEPSCSADGSCCDRGRAWSR